MKLRSYLSIIFISIGLCANAQQKATKYDVVVNFTSICCGTADDAFLKTFVKSFNKKYKVKLKSFRIGGCGREGEYKVLFQLNNLKSAVKKKFSSLLKTTIEAENKKNAAAGTNKGTINLDHDQFAGEFVGCRGTIEKWN